MASPLTFFSFNFSSESSIIFYETNQRENISQLEAMALAIIEQAYTRGPRPPVTNTSSLYPHPSKDFEPLKSTLSNWTEVMSSLPESPKRSDWEKIAKNLQLKLRDFYNNPFQIYICRDQTNTLQAMMSVSIRSSELEILELLTNPNNFLPTGIKGAGTRLIQRAEELARQHHCQKITLTALKSAVLFYASLGYALDSEASLAKGYLIFSMYKPIPQ